MYLANMSLQKKPIAVFNTNQTVHWVKSSNQLQVINSSWKYSNLLWDKHHTLFIIQDLQLFNQLLILMSSKFSLDLVNIFKAVLASNYSQSPTIVHHCYSLFISNWYVQTLLTTANKIIIFIYNMNMHQKTMIEKTINKKLLVIMMKLSSTVYLKFLKNIHLSDSVLTLLQSSVKDLQNMVTLIKTTVMLRRREDVGSSFAA